MPGIIFHILIIIWCTTSNHSAMNCELLYYRFREKTCVFRVILQDFWSLTFLMKK